MNLGPSKKVENSNQEDELVHGKREPNLLSSIRINSTRDFLQISVNCTILFVMELIFNYLIIVLDG